MLLKYLNPPLDINHLLGFPIPVTGGFPVCDCCFVSLSCQTASLDTDSILGRVSENNLGFLKLSWAFS